MTEQIPNATMTTTAFETELLEFEVISLNITLYYNEHYSKM